MTTSHPTTAPTASAQTRAAWDAIAEGFDRHVTERNLAFGDQVVARLEPLAGARVLDVAAGTGCLAIPAARRGADVVAVDIAPTMIARLGDRATAEGLTRIDARVGDAARLDFDDDGFDAVVSMNGISIVPDVAGALREAVRVTRPGGRVVVVTFAELDSAEFVAFLLSAARAAAGSDLPPLPDPPPPFRLAAAGALEAAMTEAGLGQVGVETATWEAEFSSVEAYLDAALASNPIAAQVRAVMTEAQFADMRGVLDGMFRERSGGTPAATLRSRMRIGVGTA